MTEIKLTEFQEALIQNFPVIERNDSEIYFVPFFFRRAHDDPKGIYELIPIPDGKKIIEEIKMVNS